MNISTAAEQGDLDTATVQANIRPQGQVRPPTEKQHSGKKGFSLERDRPAPVPAHV
jgi:hypothetical protein